MLKKYSDPSLKLKGWNIQIAEDKERRRLAAEAAKNATSADAVAATSQVTQEIQAKVARPAPTNTRLQGCYLKYSKS